MDKSIILDILNTRWFDLTVVIVAIALIILTKKLIVKYDKKGKVRGIITSLCIEAEKYLGDGTGVLKKKQVVTWFRLRYPTLALFVTDKILEDLIDSVVYGLNRYLADNSVTLDGLDTSINIKKADIII